MDFVGWVLCAWLHVLLLSVFWCQYDHRCITDNSCKELNCTLYTFFRVEKENQVYWAIRASGLGCLSTQHNCQTNQTLTNWSSPDSSFSHSITNSTQVYAPSKSRLIFTQWCGWLVQCFCHDLIYNRQTKHLVTHKPLKNQRQLHVLFPLSLKTLHFTHSV